MTETTQQQFNEIKQQFMLMKNGVVSDAMNAAGLPHRIIWGLNMPQLREIADRYAGSRELADTLWLDTATRESVIIAPMLLPIEEIDTDRAIAMIDEAPTLEAIDALTFYALRRRADVWDLIGMIDGCDSLNRRYAAMRLLARVAHSDTARAEAIAAREAARHDPVTMVAADNILSDLRFLAE